jgi:hypothetical protein
MLCSATIVTAAISYKFSIEYQMVACDIDWYRCEKLNFVREEFSKESRICCL